LLAQAKGESIATGKNDADELMNLLGISEDNLIDGAYWTCCKGSFHSVLKDSSKVGSEPV